MYITTIISINQGPRYASYTRLYLLLLNTQGSIPACKTGLKQHEELITARAMQAIQGHPELIKGHATQAAFRGPLSPQTLLRVAWRLRVSKVFMSEDSMISPKKCAWLQTSFQRYKYSYTALLSKHNKRNDGVIEIL